MKWYSRAIHCLVSWLLVLPIGGCGLTLYTAVEKKKGEAMAFQLQSSAIKAGAEIPRKFTCQGDDASPALSWNGAPAAVESFALIADDPDAPVGTWVHWVLYDLPATATQLAENVPKTEKLSSGGTQGRNDFKKLGYGGPCPPPGKPHRYFFKLYALDTVLNLKPGASKAEVESAMKGHVLAQAELMGTYKRQ
jgi:Raf kinase inhibitor-like YbhB/YbcL family protein